MAIRVEFYAEDQVTASSIVEFALSKGAVLQSYAEIDPPLARPPGRAGKAAAKRKHRLNGHTFVKCVSKENPFRAGGARHLAAEVIAKHRVPILYSSLCEEIDSKVEINAPNIRKTIQLMLDGGQLVITHNK